MICSRIYRRTKMSSSQLCINPADLLRCRILPFGFMQNSMQIQTHFAQKIIIAWRLTMMLLSKSAGRMSSYIIPQCHALHIHRIASALSTYHIQITNSDQFLVQFSKIIYSCFFSMTSYKFEFISYHYYLRPALFFTQSFNCFSDGNAVA